MKMFRFTLILVALAFSISACKTSDTNTTRTADKPAADKTDTAKAEKPKSGAEVKWSNKKGEGGPENWAKLAIENNACDGKVQSPIDIVSKDVKTGEKLTAIKFDYATTDLEIVNNGHTVQFNVSGDNRITIGDKGYTLLQFHYHAASEHTIDGKQLPLEVHFVHKNSDTDFAVLSVMFEEGAENALFTKYLKDFSTKKDAPKAKGEVDLMSLFPKDKSYFHYSGSLTTPPCSEVVSWYVLKNSVTASKEQLETFGKLLDGNFRPVMSLEGREVSSFGE